MDATPPGVTVRAHTFAWTRDRFGPPRVTGGADLVGTSLVETGVVDAGAYLEAVRSLARTHGATRYFAHRRESAAKLHRMAGATGLEIVRPDLPLELVARRGPVARTVLSFPSTVVHTLPLALSTLQGMYPGQTQWNIVMAGTVMATVPTILVFLLVQRWVIEGVAGSGVKG